MLRTERTLQPKMFRLPDEPVAANVLIPGFRAARSVRGAFGWFTAGWIGRLAPGLALYLNRPGAEPIDFTREPLAQLEETTWGVTLREIDGERFVVLPACTLDCPP